jgi:hypothetical protein
MKFCWMYLLAARSLERTNGGSGAPRTMTKMAAQPHYRHRATERAIHPPANQIPQGVGLSAS